MTIAIDETTKVLKLAKENKFVFDALVELSPKLKRLQNPIMQRTLGKSATLLDVAKIANVPLQQVFDKLVTAFEKHSDEKIEIDLGVKGTGEWQEELAHRQQQMKELVLELHGGGDLKSLQKKFQEIIKDVSATEVAEMEQSLISSGDLTAEQVTAMCDLHVEIFKESLDEQQSPESTPGHPIHTYMQENEKASELIQKIRANPTNMELVTELKKIITHYTRLENQLFPLLEEAEITGPSTVMWAKHDEIRDLFKHVSPETVEELVTAVDDMIYKEENILFPMALENLSEYDWVKARVGEEEIGYVWVTPGNEWKPITPIDIHQTVKEADSPGIKLNTGSVTLKELDLILRNLPMDLSFVGSDEKVKYYSATDERLFPRSPGVIGRSVVNCHPRKSFDKVNQILQSFKKGEKDKALFWLQLDGRFIIIGYYAIRDQNGKFMGTLEVSQDATEIRSLEGERRILDWE